MTKKLKLSPWHDGSVKPVHVGWYQVKGGEIGFLLGILSKGKDFDAWRYWDGFNWKWIDNYRKYSPSAMFSDDKWRGVLK